MCLIVFAWRPGHRLPLIVAANRDEFYARPTRPLEQWEHAPGVFAGRDLEAGGTWMGIGPEGRFAAVTNIRDPDQLNGPRSRGELVARFLGGEQSLEDSLADITGRAHEYTGFNLLAGDAERLFYLSSIDPIPQLLGDGIYGLSNAGLNTPWPKLLKARSALTAEVENPQPDALLALLHDAARAPEGELPDTGVGLATEALLSSVFIASPHYGTRASTVLIVQADGTRQMIEHSFGPYGARLGAVELEL